MTTLVATLAAVEALLTPLVPATIKQVLHGPQDEINEFPVAEVRFGPGAFLRQPEARLLERQSQRTGYVRLWVAKQQMLPDEAAKLPALVDAIDAIFKANPRLGELVDRFDATGYTGLLSDERQNLLFVDVNWSVTDTDEGTFVQDLFG